MHVESPAQTVSKKAIGAFSLFCSTVPILRLSPCLSNACGPATRIASEKTKGCSQRRRLSGLVLLSFE